MSIISPSSRYRHADPLIEEYLTERHHAGLATASIDTYRSVLCHADTDLEYGLKRANYDELHAWLYASDLEPASKKLYRAALNGFYSWLTHPRNPRLDFNPMLFSTPIKLKRRRGRPIPQQQLVEILARAAQPYRTWYVIAAGAGLRCCEISKLDREHVTETEIWVQGKGGAEGLVPTHPAVWETVQRLPWGPVARNLAGQRASREEIADRGNRHLDRIGFAAVTMHRLRHYFGTGVKQAAGGDITVARDGLRHASVAQTETYVGGSNDALAAAICALPLPRTTD